MLCKIYCNNGQIHLTSTCNVYDFFFTSLTSLYNIHLVFNITVHYFLLYHYHHWLHSYTPKTCSVGGKLQLWTTTWHHRERQQRLFCFTEWCWLMPSTVQQLQFWTDAVFKIWINRQLYSDLWQFITCQQEHLYNKIF